MHNNFQNNRRATRLDGGDQQAHQLAEEHRRAAFARGVHLLERQSTVFQKETSFGSAEVQQNAREWVRAYDIDPESVIIHDLRGESGSRGAHRPRWNGLLELAKAGEIGVLILPLHSRAGRFDIDTLNLIDAVREYGGYILAERRLWDPNDASDHLSLKFHASLSQRDSDGMRQWFMASKLGLATNCAYRIMLPTGLIWAPINAQYKEALALTGRSDLVTLLETPERFYECSSPARPETLYPLWFPDADVIKSAELRLEWWLETGSIGDVMTRIKTHAEWPAGKHGLTPAPHARNWVPGASVAWTRADHGTVRNWIARPAHYGIYSFTPGRSGRLSYAKQKELTPVIFERGVFPGFRPDADYDLAIRLLSLPTRNSQAAKGSTRREQPSALLRDVRCGHRLTEERVCGVRLTPFARPTLRVYRSAGCPYKNKHPAQIPMAALEDAVIATVCDALHADSLSQGLTKFRLDSSDAQARLHHAEADVARLDAEIKTAWESEQQSRRQGEFILVELARSEQTKLVARRAEAGGLVRRLSRDAERMRELCDADRNRILSLAGASHELLMRARSHPAALRRFLDVCVQSVFVTRLAHSTYEVDIDFVSGVTVRKIVRASRLVATQASCAWAAARIRAGDQPASVADQLNLYIRDSGKSLAFTADRAVAAAHEYDVLPHLGEASDDLTLTEIAALASVPHDSVLGVAVRGRLGDARVVGDSIVLHPTEQQLHKLFPEFARRAVAVAHNWPVGDTVAVSSIVTQDRTGHTTIERRASENGNSGVAVDLCQRKYVRRSEVRKDGDSPLAAILSSFPDEIRMLPLEGWQYLCRARLACPLPDHIILAYAPHITVPSTKGRPVIDESQTRKSVRGRAWRDVIFVWMGASVLQSLADWSLDEAITGSRFAGCDRQHFRTLTDATRHFRVRFGPKIGPWNRLRNAGVLTHVVALRPRAHSLTREEYVYVPPAVWDSDSRSVVHDWLADVARTAMSPDGNPERSLPDGLGEQTPQSGAA